MNLFYRTIGQGPPVIILHGLFGMSDNWMPVAKIFSSSYQVFIPDMRNHGNSPWASDMNYEIMAEDVKDFIKTCNLENPVIIGHSMGGKIAMEFALHYTSDIKALIIADIAPVEYLSGETHTDIIKTMLSVNISEFNNFSSIENKLKQYIHNKLILQSILKNIRRNQDGTLNWKLNINSIYHNQNNLYSLINAGTEYKGPALFIKAEYSDYIKEEYYPFIYNLFPSAKIWTMQKASHWLHYESPSEFAKMIYNFLAAI